jgi:hypothetical protein
LKNLFDYPDLEKLYFKNSKNIQNKIIKLLKECPSDVDGTGWIYGFHSPKDGLQLVNNFWIKIGRTERNPFVRVENEWGGKMIFCLRCSYQYRLERLIHLFFDFCREERFGICDQQVNPSNPYIRTQSKTTESRCTQTDGNISIFRKIVSFFTNICKNNHNETIYGAIENVNAVGAVSIIDEITVPHKEIEWFHFTENMNVLLIVSQVWELAENTFESELLKSPNNNVIIRPPIKKVNINNASKEELMNIPNIGDKTSNQIINYRKTHPFRSINDLKNISDYFATKYHKIKDNIEV